MFSSRSSTKEESDSRLIHLFGRILFIGLRFLPSCYWQEVALNCFRSCSHSLTQWPLLFFFFKQNIIIIFWLEWFWTKLDKGYTEQNILCMRGVEKGRQNPVSLFFFSFFFFWRPLLSSKPAVKNCLYIKSLTLWISSGAAQSLKVSADYVWHIHNNQSQLIRDLDFVLVCLGFLMLGISLFESESKFAFTNFH